ncbi:HNH endonuclease [Psychrobacter sp. FDAARGOS_221]|uniref:HNH endonuclease n=1 Tax=Psychrobacter sp. FDAARGOS_221 TaxID=1975705 RepID=UPI000BB5938E|nr:HNH endonuclease [Psychrobacter sp. FDAARGOS_221]PNK59628.1 HNH endonuclease [Psychrobacter sp. FDAARGOS_221]
MPTADFQINFLRNIQWLLESSAYTSTYKFALLVAISNLSIESGINNDSTCSISYYQLAEQFIQLYWSQALPFSDLDSNSTLRQSNTPGQIKVITSILNLQAEAKTTSLNNARTFNIKKWQSTLKEIARTIKNNPAKYLQSAENKINREFLYVYDSKAQEITLKPGVAYCFARFSKIIQKLCQQYWADFVRKNRHNQAYFSDDLDLQQFLFNQPRQNLSVLVPLLKDIQDGECFYCGGHLKGTPEVDHFIPWSKYQIDTTHNFVLADHKCNNSKRDYLAEERFYEQWLIRNQDYGKLIEDETSTMGFISNQTRSETISQWAYQVAVEHNDLVWIPNSTTRLRYINPSLLPRLGV